MSRIRRTQLTTKRVLGSLVLLTAILWSSSALAQQGAANLFRGVHYSVSGNVGLVNDYVFRGESLSDGKPAIQGGFDFAGIESMFLGVWASSGSQEIPVEFDFYGGYNPQLSDRASMDVAVTAYLYPHVMDESTWEAKLAFLAGGAALAYNYDFVLKKHYPELGYQGEARSRLSYRLRVGVSYQNQGQTSRPGVLIPIEPSTSIWDGDAQLLFAATHEFTLNLGVAYREEQGTTALFGAKTEFEFLAWK